MTAPVVLLHGLAGSSRWWAPVAERLSARHAVHPVDLRDAPSAAPESLVRLLEPLGRVQLVGHSLGGLAAIRVAARRPDLVERLALVAPAGIPPDHGPLGYALPLARELAGASPSFLRLLALDAVRTGPRALLRSAWELLGADVRAELAHIEAPTLLVWGERDALVPAAIAEAFTAAIPHARLALVAGAAHVPMLERPEETAAVLLDFLE
ncbi:MAG: alpha/beta fold hydrolase [Pseudomonadota bacterium]